MESCSINCAWTTYRATLPNNPSATNLYKDKKTLSHMLFKPLQSKTKNHKQTNNGWCNSMQTIFCWCNSTQTILLRLLLIPCICCGVCLGICVMMMRVVDPLELVLQAVVSSPTWMIKCCRHLVSLITFWCG